MVAFDRLVKRFGAGGMCSRNVLDLEFGLAKCRDQVGSILDSPKEECKTLHRALSRERGKAACKLRFSTRTVRHVTVADRLSQPTLQGWVQGNGI